jgi:hypothetical protein
MTAEMHDTERVFDVKTIGGLWRVALVDSLPHDKRNRPRYCIRS